MDPVLLAAIASPRRQEILRLVWDQELSAGAIHRSMDDVTFGAVSLQLKTLESAQLVQARVDGRFRYYRARRETLGPMAAVLKRMWDDSLWRLKLAAELEHSRRGPVPQRRKSVRKRRKP